MDDLTVHIFGTQFLLDPFSGSRIFRIVFFSWNYQTCVTYCVLRREKSSSSHCTSICNSVGIVSLEAHSRAETVWCHEHGEKTPFLHTSTEKKMVVVRWPVNFTSNWLQFCWQMEIGVVAACRPCGVPSTSVPNREYCQPKTKKCYVQLFSFGVAYPYPDCWALKVNKLLREHSVAW